MTNRNKRKVIKKMMAEIEQIKKGPNSFVKTFVIINLVAKLVYFLTTSYKPPKKGIMVFDRRPNLK